MEMRCAMAKPGHLLRLLARFVLAISVLLGQGVLRVGASHSVYGNLQTTVESTSVMQPYRTSYHFQPPKNWMNGPMIYKGIYHLFYQYNPQGPVPGHKVWAHSTSTDLVNWTPHVPAIVPSREYEINGRWSGSVTILPGYKPAILYTGANPQHQQGQNLAVPKNSSDPYLIEWVKSPLNPLMASTAANEINASSFRVRMKFYSRMDSMRAFRDPTTAWVGPVGRWRVIIGSKRDRMGMAILYRSKDFVHWTKAQHPLHSANNTGMWECPDFFPVSAQVPVGLDTSINGPNVKHVLKVSLDDTKHEYYTIGTYDSGTDKYVPDKGSVDSDSGLRYDYGKFYASKTFFDGKNNRRILWGWINESSSVDDDIKKGWSGVQAIPRTVRLDKSRKQLVQWPILEIEKLRTNEVNWPNKLIEGGTVLEVSGVNAAQADVEVSFEVKELEKAEMLDPTWTTNPQMLCSQKGASVEGSLGPFGLLVMASKGLQEYTAVFFRIFKGQNKYVVLMCSDQSRSSINNSNDKTTYGVFLNVDPVQEKLSLRTLIDHSIVESFGGGGKSCITARVYPVLAVEDGTHLHVFNNGAQSVAVPRLSAWSMKKARVN